MSFEMIKQAFIRDGGGRLQEIKGFLPKVGAPNREGFVHRLSVC